MLPVGELACPSLEGLASGVCSLRAGRCLRIADVLLARTRVRNRTWALRTASTVESGREGRFIAGETSPRPTSQAEEIDARDEFTDAASSSFSLGGAKPPASLTVEISVVLMSRETRLVEFRLLGFRLIF